MTGSTAVAGPGTGKRPWPALSLPRWSWPASWARPSLPPWPGRKPVAVLAAVALVAGAASYTVSSHRSRGRAAPAATGPLAARTSSTTKTAGGGGPDPTVVPIATVANGQATVIVGLDDGRRLVIRYPQGSDLAALGMHVISSSEGRAVRFGSPFSSSGTGVEIAEGFCGEPGSDTAARRPLSGNEGGGGFAWCAPPGWHVIVRGPVSFTRPVSVGLILDVLPG